ncbi:MAG: thioredoxin-disulfide reductase [Candidatus Margulisiibacteriota bacterium]
MALKTKAKPQAQTIIIEHSEETDLIIIGGGPAGLTAALYALRSRLNVLLIEKMVLGGTASTAFHIENYPGFPDGVSGMELMERLQKQVKNLGLNIVWGHALKITRVGKMFEVNVDEKSFTTKAIIFATGSDAAKLGIPGEEKFRGRGVSYCAACDGPFYKEKNIMVIGGGNAAIEEALFLTRFAAKISIVHRRDELRADKILVERAQSNPKIYFFWHSVAEEISGREKVTEVTLKDLVTNKRVKIPVDGVFIYIGSKPNSEGIKDLVKTDKDGFVLADENMQTSIPGIFAAGDIRVKPLRQVVTAAADGAIAAHAARKYIEELTI